MAQAQRKQKQQFSSARWVFTVNNPGEYRPRWDPTTMEFLIFSLERGKEGTPHFQGYVRLNHSRNMQQVKNILVCQEAHVEIANGSEQEAADYCRKLDTHIDGPWEFGTYKPEKGRKGHRTDLQAVAELCRAGATTREIAEASPSAFIKYTNGIAALRDTLRPPVPRERNIFVHVLWGETNTGKTHRVRMGVEPNDLYIACPGRDPWGKYEGQKVVCFEEFDWSKWPIDEVKELWDKWPKNLDARYHDKEARWTVVIACANTDPIHWYSMAGAADRGCVPPQDPPYYPRYEPGAGCGALSCDSDSGTGAESSSPSGSDSEYPCPGQRWCWCEYCPSRDTCKGALGQPPGVH